MRNDTKIKALLEQVESGKMKNDQARILNFIIHEKFSSCPLICDALGMLTQTVTARLHDLLSIGLIEIVQMEEKPAYHIYRYQPDPFFQARNAYEVKRAKFEQWKKRGILEFGEFLNENQLELNL